MLCLKKLYSEELLQLALLLSLLRVDPESYLGIDVATMGVGSLDLNNGSERHLDAHTIIHRPVFVHPKNLDSILLNYERDLFEDLNSLGRYNRLNAGRNDIHAYLLNIEEASREASNSTNISSSSANSERQISTTGTRNESQVTSSSSSPAELTQEDMDLIEVLWKQDVDLGFTLVDPATTNKNNEIDDNEKKKEETEKIIPLDNLNSTDEKRKLETEPKEEDPWAGLSYTIDLETGEHILQGNQNGSGSSTSEDSASQLLNEPELNLSDPSLVDLGDDSLELTDSLNLDNDFATDLLEGNLLGGSAVDGLLSNYSLGLPDGFNLEEALQLVGLDEPPVEKEKKEVKEKTEAEHSESEKFDSKPAESKEEADKVCEEVAETSNMIHTPQFHHNHPHHRTFHHQGRMPYMRAMNVDSRWQEFASSYLPSDFSLTAHPGYTGHGMSHGHYEAPRNVVLHNASLAAPVGDLNATAPYHNVGGPSNFGSAVATSMNLTNSSEPLGAENGAAYKSEPNDMMYYHTPTSDTINQTDGIFSLLDDDNLQMMEMSLADGDMYTMRLLEASSNNASGPAGAGALGRMGSSGATNPGVTTLTGATDERMDASSDSAVSSMGSERVPSLSDGEWMETGSNSSHTQADSHYSMDYAGKYHSPYDYSYPVPGRTGGSPRCQAERSMVPVAQKKHQMFAKRYFQEQGSPLGATSHSTQLKYEYDSHAVAAGAPGNAYAGPIEGAAGPHQPELKYSCSVDFSRHQSGRSAIEHIHHNHTYHMPPESSGSLQRPLTRDKKARKNEGEEHLTRDEKRARSLSVPIAVSDIINLPMDEFNERLSKYDLSESQLSLIRDIRRRGKNKVAAQNCRKRKLDQIISLADQVKEMRDRKIRLIREREFMLVERERVKAKFEKLHHHIFNSLRDPQGNSYNMHYYMLQHSADGNVVLVPRNQTNPHHPRSSMEPKTKPDSERKE